MDANSQWMLREQIAQSLITQLQYNTGTTPPPCPMCHRPFPVTGQTINLDNIELLVTTVGSVMSSIMGGIDPTLFDPAIRQAISTYTGSTGNRNADGPALAQVILQSVFPPSSPTGPIGPTGAVT